MAENQNIEWKVSWRDEYLKTICSFANAKGGKLFIGIDDKGNIKGVSDYKKLMEDLPNKIINHLGIVVDIVLKKDNELYYLEVEVEPFDVPISYHGKYYYRTGSTTQEMQGTTLTEFLLRKSGKTWDGIVEGTAIINDIDEDGIKAFKKAAENSMRLQDIKDESTKDLIANLRLVEAGGIKRAAIVVFGQDPRKFYPTAFIQIGKFGISDTDLKFQEIIEGNGFELADKAIDMLSSKFLTFSITYDGTIRKEQADYPFFAIREVILNAIVHRDYVKAPIQISVYDDKIIVWNEGVLPDGLSIDDLKKKHPSIPRNPLIAEVCFKGGLIEHWGRGTLKIIEECKKFKLPPPEMAVIGGGISVTIYKDTTKYLYSLGLSDRQVKAVLYIQEHGSISNTTYQEQFKVSKGTATRDLAELTEKFKVILKEGTTGVGTRYVLA
jgi:ATP-dependent DNA helicase RecG